MHIRLDALLALPALLSALVVAVPSPSPSTPHTEQLSRWRSISDRIIESVWKATKNGEGRPTRKNRFADERLPRHTLARYGGDVVLRFNVSSPNEAQELANAADTLLLDVWDFTHDWADIRLAKDVVPSLLGLLPSTTRYSQAPFLQDRNLAQAIYDTYPSSERAQVTSALPHIRDRGVTPLLTDDVEASIFFKEYRPLSVIEPWMRLFSRIYSTHVSLINIGQSYEGRSILGMRVGARQTNQANAQAKKRKTFLITGGMHAREWISTSTVNYIAFSLITGYGKTPDTTKILDEFDFVLIPTINPDGYAYSWEVDRLWRKNRQKTTVRFCQGIDLDHSFGFEWDSVTTAGNPCSESYGGEGAFEAVEARRLAEWARNETRHNNAEFIGFMDLHSYSQQILYPYSYSCDDTPPSQENLEELALGMEQAIRRSSSMTYEPMPACEGNVELSTTGGKRKLLPRIEQSGGSPLDWFYREMHVRFAYQIKLRDRGTYGFLLPKENIVPTGKEILNAVLYFADFLRVGYPKLAEDYSDTKPAQSTPLDDTDADDDWVIVADILEDEHKLDLQRRKR